MTSWATVEEVADVTGLTRDEATVALASSMIETYTGAYVNMPEDAITTRDRQVLKRATSWQAAWLTPARVTAILTEREGALSVSADAVRVERNIPAETVLAPLAIREIKNLSWVGTRTTLVPGASRREPWWNVVNFLNEASDPPWFGS